MKQVSISEALQRKYPESTVLASCCDKNGKPNAITLGWFMWTSGQPAMVAISVGHPRYSHELISETKEFVLCFPNENQADDVMYCGTYSGRDVEKFTQTSLEAIPATKVRAPLIEDSVACFECEVIGEFETGDHTIFVGKILAAHISEKYTKGLYHFKDGTLKSI